MHDDYNKDGTIFLGHSCMYQQCTTCTTAAGRAMHRFSQSQLEVIMYNNIIIVVKGIYS
jgi:hypothetical protein